MERIIKINKSEYVQPEFATKLRISCSSTPVFLGGRLAKLGLALESARSVAQFFCAFSEIGDDPHAESTNGDLPFPDTKRSVRKLVVHTGASCTDSQLPMAKSLNF
jgi:hypothetical protein